MTASDWFLWFGIFSLAATATALVRVKHLWWLMPIYFFIAWLTGELAVFHIVWQVVVAALFIADGALTGANGAAGLVLCLLSWAGLLYFHRQGGASVEPLENALVPALGPDYRARVAAAGRPRLPEQATAADWRRPFAMRRPGVELISDIAYGDAGVRNHLDIYQPHEHGGRCPVLMQIHGGAWIIGSKEQQALPLMNHLASRGWICVSVNYQLSPGVKLPQHLIDIKRALVWVRENIEKYGGDPNFIVATGGSAGGHLCSLMALTANQPQWQPGFEDADTSVAGCVPFYGVYDLLDRHRVRGVSSMTQFLERRIMPTSPDTDPAIWDALSPIVQVHPDAPPFFVLAGTHDSLVFVEEARHFVEALGKASRQHVAYAELPLAQHAFDVFHSPRADNSVFAVTRYVETLYADYLSAR